MNSHQIMQICQVSASTAGRWLSKKYPIPHAAATLLELHETHRIVPKSWRDAGFFFRDEKLITPLDDELNRVHVEQWRMDYNYANCMYRDINYLREYVSYLEAVTPRADVIAFELSRARPSLTEGKENNPLFKKPR